MNLAYEQTPRDEREMRDSLRIFHFRHPIQSPRPDSAVVHLLVAQMTTPIIAGASVAALALTGRAAILSFEAWRKAPPRMRRFYDGGFEPEMTRREAALILGVRESAAKDKVLAAHRKVMIANHPDAGGSDYIATKINEAKAKLLKKGGSGAPF